MATADATKSTEQLATPPESPFSMNWKMIDGFGGDVQITMRATFMADWPKVMVTRKEFCEKAQEAGWTFPNNGKPTATAPALPRPAVPAAAPAAAMVAAPAPAAPVGGNGHAILSIQTVSMKVKQRDDGKVDLEFWNPGREYAELKATKAPADAAALLQQTGPWTASDFATPQTYALAVTISYRLSEKKNKAGNSYKDIIDVRLTAAQ